MKDKIYHVNYWKDGKLHSGQFKVDAMIFSLPKKIFKKVWNKMMEEISFYPKKSD